MAGSEHKHPAARNADQLAWAVWISDDRQDTDIYAVVADSEREARQRALNRHDGDGEVMTVDGPYQDCEPGVWKFEYVTEHRETVVVESPHEDYASETADAERTYQGEYVQTTYEESRRLDVDLPNGDGQSDTDTDSPDTPDHRGVTQ